MTDSSWPRVKALFEAAVQWPIDQRHAMLVAETGDDEALCREVESLLASDALEGSFLDRLPAAHASVLDDPFAVQPRATDHATSPTVLTPGVRVGPYDIVSLLGAGGMGEVYRARDTNLRRDVALKVLPERFALDPERLARFAREAQVLATLNHPNIAAIFGIEQCPDQCRGATGAALSGRQALVLELVDGPTLADRIARGPLRIDEAMTIARQIAQALEAAHEKGIVHRDIKPANIKVTGNGVVKVLDFGLAKVWEGAPHADLAISPNLTGTGIDERTMLGTPSYMSPEQARGQPVDSRTDIWSFGCVCFEMLTGRAPFAADTVADTLAAILEREPAQALLPAGTPDLLRQLLRRCLAKDRERRLESADRARAAIDEAIASPAAEVVALPAPRVQGRARAVFATVAGVAAFVAFIAWAMPQPALVPPVRPSRFAIVPPTGQPLNVSGNDRDVALSPDGQHVVYRAGGTTSNGSPLHVRSREQVEARALPDIALAYAPFFSPDGRWIGFFESAEIKKVSLDGGPVITLGPVAGRSLGASWGDDNTIVFATDDPVTGLWSVSADGGQPVVLTRPEAARGEIDHQFPCVLPDGRGVLFTIAGPGSADDSLVAVLDLKTGTWKTLVTGGSEPQYADDSSGAGRGGYLLYATAGTLRAVQFDPAQLEVRSAPVTVVEELMIKPSGAANYAVSRSTLVHVAAQAVEQNPMRSLVWVDRRGREEPVRGTNPPLRSTTRFARRDTHRERHSRSGQYQYLDLGHCAADTDALDLSFRHECTPRVDTRQQADRLHVRPHGRAEPVQPGCRFHWYGPTDHDERELPVAHVGHARWLDDRRLRPSATDAHLRRRHVPTDSHGRTTGGRWRRWSHAAAGAISGQRPYPRGGLAKSRRMVDTCRTSRKNPGGRRSTCGRFQRRIATAGRSRREGTRAVWARNGLELFYLDESGALTTVPVQTSGPTFVHGRPSTIFHTTYAESNPARHYDVSRDGQRFLMLKDREPDPNATRAPIVVVDGWFGGLKWRVPPPGK